MATRISRKLEYDDRFALQQADQAIRKDVIRALVELVTNCNDSYHRLEDAGVKVNGLIAIEVLSKRENSLIRIRDFAEGMNGEQMQSAVGTYGGATSGFSDGRSVRGMWGRGLKDAIYGLGHGHVHSIQDGQFYDATLSIKNGIPTFDLEVPVRATRGIRTQYGISSGNGTVIEIVVSRPDVSVPQFDNIRRYMERHFELREIVGSPLRQVLLRKLDGHYNLKEEVQLTYKPPVGTLVLDEVIRVPDTSADIHLEVFRSNEPLSTPAEERDTADGGLLVISCHVQ
ncbi:MAG: ATP-binding protein [Chloroflexi bacterium]|nr:ATP-binding protein [Chloroflexota bacterium]